MSKPRVAIFDFACCEGCQLQIVNMEEEILDLLSVITPVEWREAISDQSEEYDIAIIEGSITRPQDEERIKEIRAKASLLIALGACATQGGVNKIKNNFDLEDVKKCVYGADASQPHLNTAMTKSVGEVVKVDFNIPGCPIDKKEFATIVKSLVQGKTPSLPTYPVCVECKAQENICRYELGEICLGPIIRAGCQAKCPSNGFWCFGCRGYVDDPNVDAAKDVMEKYNKTVEDLQSRMVLFGSK
jgi:coenzyme F420-reducing hydrogenase gamma subunit